MVAVVIGCEKGKGECVHFIKNHPYRYGSRATYHPIYNKHRKTTPEWGALDRAWVGYVIAKSQEDYEKMRKYAIVIRKFERRLNIAITIFQKLEFTDLRTERILRTKRKTTTPSLEYMTHGLEKG